MVFYHRTFSSLPSFQHQIECFKCHWKRKTESYKCSLTLNNKGTKQSTQKEKEGYFVSGPPLLLATISCSFLIPFEQFQRLRMRYLKIYKTCLKWKVKKTIVEELKLQNHNEHLWKYPKHNPLNLKGHILLISH